ncbi:MAG: hypothetical protein AAFQ98_16105 [Bacteroidota bacterium]
MTNLYRVYHKSAFSGKSLSLAFGLLVLTLLASCQPDDVPPQVGEVTFGFNLPATEGRAGRGVQGRGENVTYDSVIFTLTHQGTSTTQEYRLPLQQIGEQWVTKPIQLPLGTNSLEEYWVEDDQDAIALIAPKENSERAYLVLDPLPIDFEVAADSITPVKPEVLSTEGFNPEDFGYAFFGWLEVETFHFLLSVFEPIPDHPDPLYVGWQWAEGANLTITDPNGLRYEAVLGDSVNEVELRSDGGPYTLEILKDGFLPFTATYNTDSLITHTHDPLEICIKEGSGLPPAKSNLSLRELFHFTKSTAAVSYSGTSGIGYAIALPSEYYSNKVKSVTLTCAIGGLSPGQVSQAIISTRDIGSQFGDRNRRISGPISAEVANNDASFSIDVTSLFVDGNGNSRNGINFISIIRNGADPTYNLSRNSTSNLTIEYY